MNILATLKATTKVAKAWTCNHAPEILLGAGILSFGASLYSAVKAGEKNEELLSAHKAELDFVKSADAPKKEITKVYLETTGEFCKAYAPTAAFSALSLTCFCASYGILKKRYVALGAAYTALQNSFKLYRERVIADGGKEKDLYYLTGEKPKTVTVKDEVTGEKEKVKVYPTLPNGAIASPYAFKFGKYKANGERNHQWVNDRNMLMSYALGQQDYLNDSLYCRCEFNDEKKVIKRGAVMLNEIRDLLGEDATSAGAIVGNLFGNGEPGCNGFIDFNCMESYEIDPDTGAEIPCIWVDPNVDGIIWDKLEQLESEPFEANYYERIGE